MADPTLACLLLAAGGSHRLGVAKQLLCLNGESLVHRSARLLLAQSSIVVVVTGARPSEVAQEIQDLPARIEHNSNWLAGMGGSIATGMRLMAEEIDGVLLMLCDQWRIDQADLQTLFHAWLEAPSRVTSSRWMENFGSPAIFPRHMFSDLSQLHARQGAKELIRNQTRVHMVDLPNAQFDLDTSADLQAMRDYEKSVQYSINMK